MIVYKRPDSTLFIGWDFSPELPAAVAVINSSTVKIFDKDGTEVTSQLVQEQSLLNNELDVYIKKGGNNLEDYEIVFSAVTDDVRVAPTHSVMMKVRNSG